MGKNLHLAALYIRSEINIVTRSLQIIVVIGLTDNDLREMNVTLFY